MPSDPSKNAAPLNCYWILKHIFAVSSLFSKFDRKKLFASSLLCCSIFRPTLLHMIAISCVYLFSMIYCVKLNNTSWLYK